MQTAISHTQTPASAPSQRSRWRESVFFIVLIAFVLRLLVIVIGHTYRINPLRDHFNFGWEMGRIARSIVQGKGFSSPTDLDTGPSAWAAPVYPYILAFAFKIFGLYTTSAAFFMLAFNSVFGSLTCWTLYRIGARAYSEWVGRVAAWTWAVFPYSVYWPVRIIWEVSLSTFLLSLALWLTIRLVDVARQRDWIYYGLVWGVILLTNTTLAILLPFFLGWVIFRRKPAVLSRAYGPAISVIVMLLCITPWTIRNYKVFGRFIFIRDNLPMELHEANNKASEGLWTRREHPGNDPLSMRRFQELGEIGFMNEKKAQVHEFVRENPGQFLLFTAERIWYFWAAPPQTVILGGYDLWVARHVEYLLAAGFAFAGLVLTFRRKNQYRWLLAPFLLVYPLPYYLVNPFQRYKHPIEPVVLLLIVYVLWESRKVQLHWGMRRLGSG